MATTIPRGIERRDALHVFGYILLLKEGRHVEMKKKNDRYFYISARNDLFGDSEWKDSYITADKYILIIRDSNLGETKR